MALNILKKGFGALRPSLLFTNAKWGEGKTNQERTIQREPQKTTLSMIENHILIVGRPI